MENTEEYQAKSEKNIEVLPNGTFVIRDIIIKKISKKEKLETVSVPGMPGRPREMDCSHGFLEGDITVEFKDEGDYYTEKAVTVTRASPEAFLQIASAIRVHHDNFLMAVKNFDIVKKEWETFKPLVEQAAEIRREKFKEQEKNKISSMKLKVQKEEEDTNV